jgi:hypothetical protein
VVSWVVRIAGERLCYTSGAPLIIQARSGYQLGGDDPEVPIRPPGLGIVREPTSGCPRSKPSGKVRDTHSVGSICDHDFGVFTVTNIATENTDAVPPAHSLPGMPKAANHGLQRCRGPRVPLTCLAPLAAWQSLCTGHVDAPLENSVARAFTDRDRRSGDTLLPSTLRRSTRLPSATARPTRKQAEALRPGTGFRDVRDALRERTLVGLGEREFYRLDQV